MKKKVLIITNNDAGLFHFRKELIAEMIKEYNVTICLPEGNYINHFTELGCEFIRCDFDRHGINPIKEIALLRRLRLVIVREMPDVVLTYTIKPNIYGGLIASFYKIPFIVNITGLGIAVSGKGIISVICAKLYKIVLKTAQIVFIQNESCRDYFRKQKIVTKTKLIPGSGVNLNEFYEIDYPIGEKTIFLFAGRIMKEKGIENYIEAASEIKKRYHEVEFLVCGHFEQDYSDMIKNSENAGIIEYLGSVDNMHELYGRVSCLIHPSYYPEGISNVLLEASAVGRPLITTNHPGCRDVVNGKNGYLIDINNTNDLVNKIERFLSLSSIEKKEMGKNGRLFVENKYDRLIVTEAYINEINRLQKNNKIKRTQK